MDTNNTNNMNQITLAASVLLGFAMVAAAIYFSNTSTVSPTAARAVDTNSGHVAMDTSSPKRESNSLRRIYGNPEAATTIVEFSDYECPFCSRLHPTLQQVVDESEGTINWEYRHLPLSIHSNAQPAAVAAECVGDLLGNEAFWQYSTIIFDNQRGLGSSFFESEAIALGVDSSKYQECIASEEIANRVQLDTQKATSLGGSGTPFSVVEFADGTTRVASGALPYANWAQILNN